VELAAEVTVLALEYSQTNLAGLPGTTGISTAHPIGKQVL
jgi:hypothetical protein